jgi:nicotinamidase-related amidase
MENGIQFDPQHTAVLIMDYQNDILGMLPEEKRSPLLDGAVEILDAARKAGLRVMYIAVRFRDGYPEVSMRNKGFSGLKTSKRMLEGTPGAEIHARVAPKPGEIVLSKRRVGAFSTTELETLLRANNITNLVLLGISTSGVILSTVRWAADMDYGLWVISDACADSDEEVHRVLMEKVFPRQVNVLTREEFLKAVKTQKTQ